MKQPPRKWSRFLRSLIAKFTASQKTDTDLLLQSSVRNALTQLSDFAQQNRASIQGGTGKTALSCAHNAFGFLLFRALTHSAKGNIFISPTSIALALSMAYIGADGNTQREMAQTLQLPGMSLDALNRESASLMAMLNTTDSGVELCVANSLWMKYPDQVLPEFKRCAAQYFQADLSEFSGAPDTINNWVNEKTNGRIKQIVGKEVLSEDVHAVLVNTIYFRGEWTEPFEVRHTHDKLFTLINRQKKLCKMMSQSGHYYYLEDRNFQAIRLPYRENYISLFVFLPRQEIAYEEFLSSLTPENWLKWRERFRYKEGHIGLPRFRCEYAKNLKDILISIGMPLAFEREQADFSRLSPLFYLDWVQHKSFVEVNEEGTEASAVTSLEFEYAGLALHESDDRFEMIVDRPFFCAIVDERTESLLFLGVIVEP